MEFDATTQRGSCVPCPLGCYNLASQFQPQHQVGIYAEAGRYYSVHDLFYSDAEIEDASTCQVDRADYCLTMKPDCEGCDREAAVASIKRQCWASAKCQWFPDEQICSFRDVRQKDEEGMQES